MFNPMSFLNTFKKYWRDVFYLILALCAFFAYRIQVGNLKSQVETWQNQAALSSKTVEDQKGLFERQVQQSSNVQSVINAEKDAQIVELAAQLKKTGEKLDNATTVGLSWKKAYEGTLNARQVLLPRTAAAEDSPNAVSSQDRIEVDFNQNWGFIGVTGYTKTNPAEAYLKVSNLRPLKLTVALSQATDGSWHAYTTSSEENIQADILVSAVNPSIRDIKWFERLGVVSSLGIGNGVLAGAGVTLDIDKISVGPQVWIVGNTGASVFYGATAIWRPWAR